MSWKRVEQHNIHEKLFDPSTWVFLKLKHSVAEQRNVEMNINEHEVLSQVGSNDSV